MGMSGTEGGDLVARGRRDVLAAAVLWSLSGVVTKSLDLDGLSIAFYRGLFAGMALMPFVPRSRWAFRPALVPLGLAFGAMTGLYIAAVKATTAANAIFLQCSATFWTVPLSALLLRERPDRRSLIGIALATVGIAAIVSMDTTAGGTSTGASPWAWPAAWPMPSWSSACAGSATSTPSG